MRIERGGAGVELSFSYKGVPVRMVARSENPDEFEARRGDAAALPPHLSVFDVHVGRSAGAEPGTLVGELDASGAGTFEHCLDFAIGTVRRWMAEQAETRVATAEKQLEWLRSGITIYHGDCFEVLHDLSGIGALITDPPYSSGGAFRGDRAASTTAKYVQTTTTAYRPEFAGDSRDQRSFLVWSTLWLGAARAASRPGAPIACFIDWRQLPVLSDAVQAGGWTWRGVAVWSKKFGRPTPGSGTTLRAARDAGLTAIGIECDEANCEIAARRLAQEALDFGAAAPPATAAPASAPQDAIDFADGDDDA